MTEVAYIFERIDAEVDIWVELTERTASDGSLRDRFGHCFSTSGDTSLVGASGDDELTNEAAYLFARDGGGTDNWGK